MERVFSVLGMGLVALALGFWGVVLGAEPGAEAALRQKALALNQVTGGETMEGEVKILVADVANTRKLLAVAVAVAKEKPQPFNYNAAYILAHAALGLKDLEAGRTFFRICIDQARAVKSGRKLATSYRGLLELLLQQKKSEEAIQVCKEILEMEDRDGQVHRLKTAVLQLVIQTMAQQGQTEEAIKLVENLLKAQPGNWRFLELKGMVLREGRRLEEAAKTYEEVLTRVNADTTLKTEEKSILAEACRYLLSGVYTDLNRIDKATEQLKLLLEKKPNSPTYNNDLGYIWADNDQNLDQAEQLVRKALEEDRKLRKKLEDLPPERDRDNAAYLDSMGWVLYKKKQNLEAKKYLLQAVEDKEFGQQADIFDHLGDVYLALGDKAKALAAWKKALEVTRKTWRDQERKGKIEKKIKENQ